MTISDEKFLKANHISVEPCPFCEHDREVRDQLRERLHLAERCLEGEHGIARREKVRSTGWMALACLLGAVVLLQWAYVAGKVTP